MTRSAYPGQTPDRLAAQRARDAALDRVSRVRGMTILGAGALTAAFAAVVSAVAPGHTLGAKLPASAPTVVARQTPGTGSPKMPPLASPSQLGLQSPGGAPQAAPQTAQPAQAQQQAAPPQPAPVSGGS